MMKVVLNAGSDSQKCSLFELPSGPLSEEPHDPIWEAKGVLTFPRTDFGLRPKCWQGTWWDAAEVHPGKPQLDLSKASAVECILSRRDSIIVARHEVPGKASRKRTVP